MSEFLEKAAAELSGKVDGFDSTAKFDVIGEGAIMLDGSGARVADEEADVTMSADMETFEAIFSGDLNPTGAFMTGKLKIDGDMGVAMKLASVLA
ncbi:SCP2 sterol-binding domain-containing protein [Phaeobacter marinintestinus]|uniref:SCP2 sterol-binding domain-containing protein n=1 Tax=Falsiphaeobacter marinintestinus TaxID=1492905 RepID=UPI0011B4FBF7|nr:SCP2 sterol-binding domain-containing protein [Phaeobacter marinintestinus]